MAAPVVTASLDAAAYSVGDTIMLTVSYGDTDTETITITVQATDKAGNTSAPVSVSALIDPVNVAVADDGERTWSKLSDTGAVAVFTATA